MTAFLNINWGGVQVDALTLTLDEQHATDVYYSINLEDLLAMPEARGLMDRHRRQNRRFINRIADPEHGSPILRHLIETLGPILIKYLLENLPTWLADLEHLKEEPTTA